MQPDGHAMSENARWYAEYGCGHAHCPHGCEKPQPRIFDGVFVCGRCLILCDAVSPMVPCVPAVCGDTI